MKYLIIALSIFLISCSSSRFTPQIQISSGSRIGILPTLSEIDVIRTRKEKRKNRPLVDSVLEKRLSVSINHELHSAFAKNHQVIQLKVDADREHDIKAGIFKLVKKENKIRRKKKKVRYSYDVTSSPLYKNFRNQNLDYLVFSFYRGQYLSKKKLKGEGLKGITDVLLGITALASGDYYYGFDYEEEFSALFLGVIDLKTSQAIYLNQRSNDWSPKYKKTYEKHLSRLLQDFEISSL